MAWLDLEEGVLSEFACSHEYGEAVRAARPRPRLAPRSLWAPAVIERPPPPMWPTDKPVELAPNGRVWAPTPKPAYTVPLPAIAPAKTHVIVCGSSAYAGNPLRILETLRRLESRYRIDRVATGSAIGIGAIAAAWARAREHGMAWIPRAYEAARNMLSECLRIAHKAGAMLIIAAFPGDVETRDLLRAARASGVRVVQCV